jgi:hypothetical protein
VNAPATSVVSASTSEGCSGVAEREAYTQSVQQINPVGVKTKTPNPQCHVPERYVPNIRVADPDPNWIRIQSGQWIRIQERKNEPQKKISIQPKMLDTDPESNECGSAPCLTHDVPYRTFRQEILKQQYLDYNLGRRTEKL